MGWCRGTVIFDTVCDMILDKQTIKPEDVLTVLTYCLEDMDWDCQNESDYWDHPAVQKIMKKIHPRWFD